MTPSPSPPPPNSFSHGSPITALQALLPRIRTVEHEGATCYAAAGRFLAAPVITDRASPAADLSAMDGFAVRLSDLAGGALPIAGEVRIGHAPPPLPPGACLRIVTGGGIPKNADTVIRHEDVSEAEGRIRIDAATASRLAPGQNIRRAGENGPAGTTIAREGTLVSPAVSAALATFGAVHVRVYRPLSVAIITTGDELVEVGAIPSPWQVRDSNAPALLSLLNRWPWISDLRPVHAADEPGPIARAIATALSWADAVLITGGVSKGHRDFIPETLAGLGASTVFHRVAQRPGMPVLGAISDDGRPILGLPGNPVSVLVTARRMAWPALARRAGAAGELPAASVTITNPDERRLALWWHRPVRLEGPGRASIIDTHGSGDLIAASAADGFIEQPPDSAGPGPWPFFAWRP